MNKEDIEDKSHFPFGTICMIAYIFSIISLCAYGTYIFFTSLIIGVICMILAIFQSDDSGGTIGGGGLPWKL